MNETGIGGRGGHFQDQSCHAQQGAMFYHSDHLAWEAYRQPIRHQGWQRRGDAEARGADFDASDGGARRPFKVGGVKLVIYSFNHKTFYISVFSAVESMHDNKISKDIFLLVATVRFPAVALGCAGSFFFV
jgi:hypothetical protein